MAQPTLTIVTPSFEGDLERCRLLCESMDRMATAHTEHVLLVADHDEVLFKPLKGPRRRVITDSELLPRWLKAFKPPLGRNAKWRWIGNALTKPIWPMSGWHVQQLRKLLVARLVTTDILVMADSDSVFVRPFGPELFVTSEGEVRLFAMPGGIGTDNVKWADHHMWTRNAAELLGLPAPAFPATDYIINLVSWRRDHALSLVRHVQETTGLEFVEAMGRRRTFSEYQLYGAYAEGVLGGAGHKADAMPLSHTYWSGEALTKESFIDFVDDMNSAQIAVCVQSFTNTSVDVMRGFLDRQSQKHQARA